MIRKIVVPVDGTEASEKILPHLSELFRVADADIRFVHVADWSESGLRRGREYLEDLTGRARERFPFIGHELLKGEAWFEILRYAIVSHADLIAMTTSRSSSVRRFLFGSTAVELLRHSQVPIYLARPSWAARPIGKILVPLDGSRASQGILPVVADLAQAAGSKVAFMTALPNPELKDSAAKALLRASAPFFRRGLAVKTVLKTGEAVRGILEAAREESADLIALGSHGRQGSDRFFFGSVAEEVIGRSEVPLLLRRKPLRLLRRKPVAPRREAVQRS